MTHVVLAKEQVPDDKAAGKASGPVVGNSNVSEHVELKSFRPKNLRISFKALVKHRIEKQSSSVLDSESERS